MHSTLAHLLLIKLSAHNHNRKTPSTIVINLSTSVLGELSASVKLPLGGSETKRPPDEAEQQQLQPPPLAPAALGMMPAVWRPLAAVSVARINILCNSILRFTNFHEIQREMCHGVFEGNLHCPVDSRKSVAKTQEMTPTLTVPKDDFFMRQSVALWEM